MNPIKHVAIIMDGNGRWGVQNKGSRNLGHRAGLNTIELIIDETIKQKIDYLTLYTFSTENWKRPENEINFLFDLIRKSLKKKLKQIIKQGVKINIIGRKQGLPNDIKQTVNIIQKKTFNNKTITLNLALNYGAKDEILNALKMLVNQSKKKINHKNFEKNLYTYGMPDPEILIRTGGTKRLSNFMLWQIAYTEIFFIDKLWPDFNERDFNDIIYNFNKIKRNFGKI